jgi:hypothetical protein
VTSHGQGQGTPGSHSRSSSDNADPAVHLVDLPPSEPYDEKEPYPAPPLPPVHAVEWLLEQWLPGDPFPPSFKGWTEP